MITSVLMGLWALTAAQSVTDSAFILDPTDCLATAVTMSSCTSFFNKANTCFDTDDSSVQAECYCPQSVLDYIAGCHQEWWDCFPTPIVDNLFLGTTGLYYNWSTVCQEVFTYSPTTMIVTKPTAYDQEFCLDVALDCNSLTVAMTSCSSTHSTAAKDLNSCLCNDDMLYLGSRCDIDANERCLRRTLDPMALYSNQMCGNTTGTATTSRLLASSSTPPLLEPTSTYVPPTPSSTARPGATATSVSTGKGVARLALSERSMSVTFALIIAVFAA
ncbi:hypothetical protein DL95DRAFT_406451 [Leptodontidium sp. 2 PMI_412]|nr:hypothetical protein DL95DRAFT_406451 [Leptodontidium sp. 2 PMI_412]